jgi:hypothetical protein
LDDIQVTPAAVIVNGIDKNAIRSYQYGGYGRNKYGYVGRYHQQYAASDAATTSSRQPDDRQAIPAVSHPPVQQAVLKPGQPRVVTVGANSRPTHAEQATLSTSLSDHALSDHESNMSKLDGIIGAGKTVKVDGPQTVRPETIRSDAKPARRGTVAAPIGSVNAPMTGGPTSQAPVQDV